MTDSVSGQVLNDEQASAKSRDTLSKDRETVCEPCKEDGYVKPVEGFCVQCQHYLCDKCFRCHRIPKPTRHHRLLSKHELPKKKVGEDLSEICPRHEGEVIKYYCKNHGTVGCNCCMITEHKQCQEVSIVADLAKGMERSIKYKDFCARMAKTNRDFGQQLAKARRNADITKSCCNTAIDQINKLQENINKKFDKLCQEITRQAEDIMKEDIKRIQKARESAKCARDQLEDVQNDLKVLEETKQRKQLFIAVIRGEEKQINLEERLREIKTENTVKRYCFIPNELMTSMLQNIDTIGEMCMYERNESPTDIRSSCANYPEYGIKKGIPLSNQNFVFLDSIFNSVVLYDKEYKRLVTEKKLTSCPWDAAVINRNKFAVTLPNEKKVKLLSVSNESFTESKDIVVDARCEGIAYADNKLFLACNKPAKVLILNMTGEIIREISNDESGDHLFKQLAYISFNEKSQCLCVTDRKSASATLFTINGTVKGVFKHKNMKYPLATMFLESDSDQDELLVIDYKKNSFKFKISTGECKQDTSFDTFFNHVILNPNGADEIFVGTITLTWHKSELFN